VAEALDVHISNASRICDRLVLAGLLHRRDSPADRRHVELTITHRGAALVSAVADHQRHLVHQVLAAMPLRQRAHLTAALTSFTLAAQQLTSAPAAAVSL
jgi:DNA-binding MarR family transcriptional regulator